MYKQNIVAVGKEEEAEPQDAEHRCEISFARRGVRARFASACDACWIKAQRIPLVGSGLRASSIVLARAACAELTPTYEPTWTLRVLQRLPWRAQRLGARLWLQTMLHGFEQPRSSAAVAAASSSSSSSSSASSKHPMAIVRTLPLLGAAECDAAIAEAEAHAKASGGWLTDRHVSYPTTDIPIRKLPNLSALWNETLFPKVAKAFGEALELPEGSVVTPLDVFVVKYDHQGQRELAVHRDNGLLTFSLLLSDPDDFVGGGTYFEASGRVYRPTRGVGVLHSALVRHAGYPIGGGTRYVLVGFCGLSSSRLPAGFEDWRFGSPPWFVSSRVVGDEQILSRVWPVQGGGDVEAPAEGGSSLLELAMAMEEAEEGEEEGEEEEESFPTLEEMLESGELTQAEYEELAGGLSEEDEEEEGEEAEEAEEAEGEQEVSSTAMSSSSSSSSQGVKEEEKPWYLQQHEIAMRARQEGTLVEAAPYHEGRSDGYTFEMWRNGGDLVALLVDASGEATAAATKGASAVEASVVYRSGPLTPDMHELLYKVLPPAKANSKRRGARGVWRRIFRRAKEEDRLAGMVHVYVRPGARGAASGEALTRFSMAALSRCGFTYALTLADDKGSGKLREWYERLGFVAAVDFEERAMVARTAP